MNFGVIEVGSTNTKAYLYKDGQLENLGARYIAFKTNYKKNNSLLESDVKDLCSFIEEIQKQVDKVYMFGTSIFRNITDEQREEFIKMIKDNYDIDFRVVSAEEESKYTVQGVIHKINKPLKLAVVIGGGGSTEIAIIENGKTIKTVNLNFGAMDITEHFPELKGDTVETDFQEMLDYTLSLVPEIDEDVDTMVLAGGDYIYFYETVGYAMEKNDIYEDDNQPYMIEFDIFNDYDADVLSVSFDDIRAQCPGNEGWWDGARGMRFCMNAIARRLNAKYIIPTRINMLIGLAAEIEEKNK